MATKRRLYSADFKAKIALEALKGIKTSNEIASQYSVHPAQISLWKKQALDGMTDIFTDKRKKLEVEDVPSRDYLMKQLGELHSELDWLKKKISTFP